MPFTHLDVILSCDDTKSVGLFVKIMLLRFHVHQKLNFCLIMVSLEFE